MRLDRIPVLFHRLKRCFRRSEWVIRLLGLSRRTETATPGLLMIQIDGLSLDQLKKARAAGRMPFLDRLLQKERYDLHSLYS